MNMSEVKASLIRSRKARVVMCLMLGLTLLAPGSAFADKKKKDAAPPTPKVIDYSNIVWPNPPAIARVRFQAWFAAEKMSQVEEGTNTKEHTSELQSLRHLVCRL